jgi:hypothetical protein
MRWLVLILILPIALAAGLFFALTDAEPLLARNAKLSMEDLDRGRQVLQQLGLSSLQEGEMREVVVEEADLDKGLNYLVSKAAQGSASARIALGQVILRASVPIPPVIPSFTRYLNLELALAPAGKLLEPVELRLGSVTVPEALLPFLFQQGLVASGEQGRYNAALKMLEKAEIRERQLALRYTWNEIGRAHV